MTIEDLKAHPAFVTLATEQQKTWILEYCSNGADKIKATEAAYATNDTASTVAVANRNMRHPAIKRLIKDFYGMVDETGTRDEFLALLWKKVQGGSGVDDKTQLGWANIYMKVKGYEAEKAAPPDSNESAESVDDLVLALESKGKL